MERGLSQACALAPLRPLHGASPAQLRDTKRTTCRAMGKVEKRGGNELMEGGKTMGTGTRRGGSRG